MTSDEAPLATSFPEPQAKGILARAAALDAADAVAYTADDLRQIAADARIAPTAIDAALRETTASQLAVQAPGIAVPELSLAAATGFMGLGATLGGIAWLADAAHFGPEAAAAVFGPTAAFVLYRSLRHRWHGSLIAFLEEAVLYLGPFTLALTLVGGTDATMPGLIWSGVCTAVGSGIVSLRLHTRAAPAAGTRAPTEALPPRSPPAASISDR